jgi:hypothetical protein
VTAYNRASIEVGVDGASNSNASVSPPARVRRSSDGDRAVESTCSPAYRNDVRVNRARPPLTEAVSDPYALQEATVGGVGVGLGVGVGCGLAVGAAPEHAARRNVAERAIGAARKGRR